jgi:hypothetical protein
LSSNPAVTAIFSESCATPQAQAAGSRQQAAGSKQQAASSKQQAASNQRPFEQAD